MVEHSIRIRGVGGSIPPISTSFFLCFYGVSLFVYDDDDYYNVSLFFNAFFVAPVTHTHFASLFFWIPSFLNLL